MPSHVRGPCRFSVAARPLEIALSVCGAERASSARLLSRAAGGQESAGVPLADGLRSPAEVGGGEREFIFYLSAEWIEGENAFQFCAHS